MQIVTDKKITCFYIAFANKLDMRIGNVIPYSEIIT